MSVCKIIVQNLMKKRWLVPGRFLARSEKNAFYQCCFNAFYQCRFTLLYLLEGKYKTLEFD